mgnify:CR=1 FL=1
MAFLNFITRRAFFGRHSAAEAFTVTTGGNRTFDHFGSVLQATFDDQRLIFDLENLLGIGHLRQTELFGHLRTHLGRIAVDGLAACDDHVG